ncbi:MAG: electron transfer flavoprotein subunit beta/FixA family protein [Nitrososphaeria archaeon]|nr:electron transfer flavoprotein subunit beta/FixA family protein [Conexivisphaerales archaeon]
MGLEIILLFKYVPNTTTVNVDPNTGTLIREGVPSVVNPHDLVAAEFALRLKEKYGGRIRAMIMAPPSATKGIEYLVGMGVDEGILLTDRAYGGADTLATSYVISQAIKKVVDHYDLIVAGQETLDSSTAHIGAQVSSWLGIPYVYYVTEAELQDGHMILTRQLETYVEKYRVKLPALISVLMHTLQPRDVTLKNKMKAVTQKPVKVYTNNELQLNTLCTGLKGSPTIVAKTEFIGKIPRKMQVIQGKTPEEMVSWLISKLKEEKVI